MPWGWRLSSVVCNVPVLSQNDSTYHHSVFTTWKWHPYATWTPSFIILVWGHHPPLRRTVFACLQNCYNSCISCRRSALRYDSINSKPHELFMNQRTVGYPSTSWASCFTLIASRAPAYTHKQRVYCKGISCLLSILPRSFNVEYLSRKLW